MALIGAPRGLKAFVYPFILIVIAAILVTSYRNIKVNENYLKNFDLPFLNGKPKGDSHQRPANTHAPPKYKPTFTSQAPAATDPFPLLASTTATPPPIPPYNVPRPDLHRDYGLPYVPPLFIGFTRQWPMLLQCVVGYLTAGWPPESIIVVENTGVQNSNAEGLLSLQNPFYLNHSTLRRLGVTIIQTPVLLTFSQLQNFFLATAHARSWPYYFYSHQDVLVMSFEDGADTIKRPGDRNWYFYDEEDEAAAMRAPAAGQPGYRTIYENSLRELNRTVESGERWAFRWFQYDHLTLVNRAALDAVGGWDSLMPYYSSDCDMNARLGMDGWTMRHRRVGIINDVSTVMEDLAALYRDPNVTPRFVDPNPIPEKPKEPEPTEEQDKAAASNQEQTQGLGKPPAEGDMTPEGIGNHPSDEKTTEKFKGDQQTEEKDGKSTKMKRGRSKAKEQDVATVISKSVEYFRELLKVADEMGLYKYRDENHARNSWQASQNGGVGEPYYYPAAGFAESFWVLTEAGREVFRRKWGHRECDLLDETALQLNDQWRVEKDWE